MTKQPDNEPERRYHHGNAADALLNAAEAILQRDGVAALTLRAVSREAGLSHAAPKNHFGDLSGLLSELAAVGFRRLATDLQTARGALTEADDAMDAIARAYVHFAKRQPGMFLLMYRSERLNFARPALVDAMQRAAGALNSTTAMRPTKAETTQDALAPAVAAWSLVHGYAMLLVDKRLHPMLQQIGGDEPDEMLLDAVLESVKARTKKSGL